MTTDKEKPEGFKWPDDWAADWNDPKMDVYDDAKSFTRQDVKVLMEVARSHEERKWLHTSATLEATIHVIKEDCLSHKEATSRLQAENEELRKALTGILLLCESSGEPIDGFRFRQNVLDAWKLINQQPRVSTGEEKD